MNLKYLISLFFLWGSCHAKHEVAVAAIFQNEARFLHEWISYHHARGVTHFRLYNNNSSDNYRDVLDQWIRQGVVTLIDWPGSYRNEGEWGKIQIGAFNDAIKKLKKKAVWLLLIDIDEFVVCKKQPLLEYLRGEFKDESGIFLNWQHFGTNNIWEVISVIGELIKRAPSDWPQNKIGKSIIKLSDVKRAGNAHHHIFKKKKFCVDTDHRRLKKFGIEGNTILTDKIVIHHYWCRDKKFMEEQKIPRRLKWNGKATAIRVTESLMNQVEDYSALGAH